MSGLFSPKLAILSDWRSSLSVAFSYFRRIKFVVENTFELGDFDPQTNWKGMTVTNYEVYRARYLKIWKFAWISIDIIGTVAAPFAPNVVITVPFTMDSSVTKQQGGAATCTNGGLPEACGWVTSAANGPATISFYRMPVANFGAGIVRLNLNAFLEIQ